MRTDIAGGKKECRRHVEVGQEAGGVREIVFIAVVERDGNGTGHVLTVTQAFDQLGQAQHTPTLAQHAQLCLEALYLDVFALAVFQPTMAARTHAVIHQHDWTARVKAAHELRGTAGGNSPLSHFFKPPLHWSSPEENTRL